MFNHSTTLLDFVLVICLMYVGEVLHVNFLCVVYCIVYMYVYKATCINKLIFCYCFYSRLNEIEAKISFDFEVSIPNYMYVFSL